MRSPSKQRSAFHWLNDTRGAAAIIVTIIMLAAAVLIVSTASLLGVDNLDIGFSSRVSDKAVVAAESCVEEAFLRLTRNTSYSGGSLDVGETTCTIAVTGTPCGSCTISVEAVHASYERNVEVDITLSGGNVEITSWEEID